MRMQHSEGIYGFSDWRYHPAHHQPQRLKCYLVAVFCSKPIYWICFCWQCEQAD